MRLLVACVACVACVVLNGCVSRTSWQGEFAETPQVRRVAESKMGDLADIRYMGFVTGVEDLRRRGGGYIVTMKCDDGKNLTITWQDREPLTEDERRIWRVLALAGVGDRIEIASRDIELDLETIVGVRLRRIIHWPSN